MSTRYATAKRIVANRQFEVVEGMVLDVFTASALVAVYEALNPEAQAKFDTIAPLERVAKFALQKVSS